MPPDGYTTVTLSDDVISKLSRILVDQECESYAEAIEYAVDETLAQNGSLDESELAEVLHKRLQ